jgi:hypothetical protein
MLDYTVSLFCADCWRLHTVAEHIRLDKGPIRYGPLREIFAEDQTPLSIRSLLRQPVLCPNSQRKIVDPGRVYVLRKPGNGSP